MERLTRVGVWVGVLVTVETAAREVREGAIQ